MRRSEGLKRLDKKTRNKLRAILSDSEGNAMGSLAQLHGKLGRDQSAALEAILNSSALLKAVKKSTPFPKKPPFADTFQVYQQADLTTLLNTIEKTTATNKPKLNRVVQYLSQIDSAYAQGDIALCRERIVNAIERTGWSHAILRRIVLIRENLPEENSEEAIEALVQQANLKEVAVASLIHAYSLDKSILTIKRSILNMPDRGAINRFSRHLSRLAVQPFAKSREDLAAFLLEVEKCSLIDAIILLKFNSHLLNLTEYPAIAEIATNLGQPALFEQLVATFDVSDTSSEYNFFKQSTAWLE